LTLLLTLLLILTLILTFLDHNHQQQAASATDVDATNCDYHPWDQQQIRRRNKQFNPPPTQPANSTVRTARLGGLL